MIEEYRLLNFLLSSLVAMFVWVWFNDRPRTVSRSGRMLRHGIVAAFALGAAGSLELYYRNAPVSIAGLALTAVFGVILVSLWLSRSR